MRHGCRGGRAGLLTRHGKAATIGPVLQDALGLELVATDAFDTDTLGTFSGEVERTLPARDCALRKAELAIALTGLDIGIGSEGTFGPGPLGALVTWNIELLVWHDRARNWTVTGRAQGPSQARRETLLAAADALRFAAQAPVGQAFIVRGNGRLFKGLYHPDAILAAASACLGGPQDPPACIEFDLRACHSPERRARIAAAARDLANRLLALCPRCGRPDFSPTVASCELPCAECAAPVPMVTTLPAACTGCGYTTGTPAPAAGADPAQCPLCNP